MMAAHIPNQLIGTEEDFQRFLARFQGDGVIAGLALVMAEDESAIRKNLEIYLGEMQFGYKFLAKRLPAGRLRILEIGAGLGLLSAYLHQQGHTVTALEPAATAFGMFEATRREIWSLLGSDCPTMLEKGAEDLSVETDGHFDFIFSMNVMEHIAELEKAFAATASVLAKGGTWVNSCPNYIFPYEPHYALPLVPFAPRLSRNIFAKNINSSPETWDTLNFIDWLKVRRLAALNGLSVAFEDGTLHASLARIGDDPNFENRHRNGIVPKVFHLLNKLGILGVTRLVPPALATPMIFKLKHNQEPVADL